MTTEKTPAARKPADGYTFTVAGKRHKLPYITEAVAGEVPGGLMLDAVMNPDDEMAQIRLGLAHLSVCGASEAAITALRSLPTKTMMEHIGGWMGESSGSSAS